MTPHHTNGTWHCHACDIHRDTDDLPVYSGSHDSLGAPLEALGTMKNTVKKLSIPLLCVSQINRNVETRNPPRPIMSDIKESGDIEAKADCIMLLYRESYYKPVPPGATDIMELIIAKSRNGMCGAVNLEFDGRTMSIKEGIGL